MRKVTLVRLGLAASLAALGIAGVVGPASMTGCSGDDNTGSSSGSSSGGKVDSGSSSGGKVDSGSSSGGGSGGGSGGDAQPPPPNAKLVVVHAAPPEGLGPVRVCFSQGTAADGSDQKIAQLPPLPHAALPGQPFPGVFNGTGGPFPDITDLSGVAITPYVLRAENPKVSAHTIADTAEPDCTKFIGTKGDGSDADPALKLTLGVDYYKLALIPANTFQTENTYLVAVSGCPAAADPNDAGALSTGLCGSTYTAGAGNLAGSVAKLDTTFDAGAGIGAQFAHRSSAIEGLPATADTTLLGGGPNSPVHAPASLGVIPTFLFDVDAGEAGVATQPSPLTAAPVKFGATQLDPGTAISPAGVNVADPSVKFGVITLPGKDDGGAPLPAKYPGGDFFALSLPIIQLTSTGNAPPPYGDAGALMFQNGETYTFVLVGDPEKTFGAASLDDAGQPTIAPGTTPLLGLHFLAFPNHLAVPPYQ